MARRSSKLDRLRAAVAREHTRLYEILDVDAAAAIAEARQTRLRDDLGGANAKGLCAAILIDAGGQLADADVVEEGVALLREIERPDAPQFAYNIANGLAALARIRGANQLGQLDTAAQRQEVRTLFQRAAEKCDDPSVQSSSLTNLANQLKDSYRWVEAYDTYAAALHADPTNAVALSGISSLLRWRMKRRLDEEGPLRRAAVRYLLRARHELAQAHRYVGPQGVARIEELLREFNLDDNAETPKAEPSPVSEYAAFVRRHRLALCFAPESVGTEVGRWDHLAIRSVTQAIDSGPNVPIIFASWNLLKADYLAARWLAHVAIEGAIPETGAYSDTLDYANYGARHSGIVLAQKAALDVLDKVAVAATDYLGLSGDPQRVYFATRWHVRHASNPRQFAAPLKWEPDVEAEIVAGNPSLIALAELAHDYASGYLRSKKNARNSGTHRLVVLHDMWIDGRATPSAIVDRYGQTQFEDIAISSLQVARAALFYFHEMVATRERRFRRSTSGPTVSMAVPSHHYVRGETDADQ